MPGMQSQAVSFDQIRFHFSTPLAYLDQAIAPNSEFAKPSTRISAGEP